MELHLTHGLAVLVARDERGLAEARTDLLRERLDQHQADLLADIKRVQDKTMSMAVQTLELEGLESTTYMRV